ncbi:MAG: cyclic nucleotide-binding domain-containing protein [Thermodesulfobacteriota bacterium]|nr:cyclic nucleotide-binding domain-containing protein [Thermodesulfobacteriota bacterium]
MDEKINGQKSIAGHIIDGSITIDSVSDFESMLGLFPDNPALFNAFGDLLVKKKSYKAAARAYGRAAGLFFDSGMMFPAILSKVLQWRIIKPTLHEVRPFFANLQRTHFSPSLLKNFFKSLSFPEMVSITNRLIKVRLPSGDVFKKIGDVENYLYFIASGTLKETTYQPLSRDEKKHRKSIVYLSANDIVGDIYPFEEEKLSQSYTEAVTSVEMGKISKKGLITVCTRYPNVAHSIIKLFKDRKASRKKSSRSARKSSRHSLPLKMKLKIRPKEAGYPPFILDGFSRDISVGGVCVVLDAKHKNVVPIAKNIQDAGVTIYIPGGGFTLNVSGTVVWSRGVISKGKKTLALGIKFKGMTPKVSGLLVVFADMLYKI